MTVNDVGGICDVVFDNASVLASMGLLHCPVVSCIARVLACMGGLLYRGGVQGIGDLLGAGVTGVSLLGGNQALGVLSTGV